MHWGDIYPCFERSIPGSHAGMLSKHQKGTTGSTMPVSAYHNGSVNLGRVILKNSLAKLTPKCSRSAQIGLAILIRFSVDLPG
jgi:hypothetical protein